MSDPPQKLEASKPLAARTWLNHLAEYLHKYPDDHPLQISLRTYALALFLTLSPPVMSFVTSARLRAKGIRSLLRVFRRELGVTGFAFAMTVAVGGGSALRKAVQDIGANTDEEDTSRREKKAWRRLLIAVVKRLSSSQRTFLSYLASSSVAIALLQYPTSSSSARKAASTLRSRPSPTLDLTLLLLVRALDYVMRLTVLPSVHSAGKSSSATEKEKENLQAKRQLYTRNIDAFVFWASSARIMWCFFYEPHRLPHSYNRWIMSLANIDPRILGALRALQTGKLSYVHGISSIPDLVPSLSRDLGYPPSWGDIPSIPAYGGPSADAKWKALGVTSRKGLGGLPCELVHGNSAGPSCTKNALLRGGVAFFEAVAIYLPVHVLPILVTRPRKLLRGSELFKTLLAVTRSASFLSTFVSSIWFAICLTRTLLFARLFPFISHDFWDGPFGCTFVGSLVCGSSIWIEQGRRRGEMALYVLPRAMRACFSEGFLKNGRGVRLLERMTFVLSLATLLTAFWHGNESLRGLSRWTIAFIMRGPNAGFWKRKTEEVEGPSSSFPPR